MEAATPLDERILLEKVHVAARQEIGPQVLHDMEANVMVDMVTQRTVIELRSFLYAERLKPIVERTTHIHPRSPWQGYKAQWWPLSPVGRFLLRFFPVRQHEVTAEFKVERLKAFPDNTRLFPPELGPHVALYQSAPPYWKS